MSASSSRPARRRVSLWMVIKIILGLLLAALVLSRTDLGQLLSLRSRISGPYLFATVVLFILLSMLKAWQYHKLLNTQVSYPQALSVAILQNAISNFVATSAGAVAYLTMLKAEQGVKLSRSASVFLLLKVGDLFSLGLGLLVSLLFIREQAAAVQLPIAILLSFIFLVLLIFAVSLINRKGFTLLFRRLLERMGLLRFRVFEQGVGFLDSLAQFDPRELSRLIVTAGSLSLLYFALTIAWTYTSLHVFSLPVSVWAVVFATSMLQLLSIVPIQIFGGLGVSEAASLFLFGLFGFAASQLAAVLIGMRLLFTAENLLVLIYLPLLSMFLQRPVDRSEARQGSGDARLRMFKFGENWASFSKQLDESRIEAAEGSLTALFGEGTLKGKSFLDIGCGSGLFSIAAARLGAQKVLGMDVDPVSVATSCANADRWLEEPSRVSFFEGSVLDTGRMKDLGCFDVVYSWGVLHHTGNMALAIHNAAECVGPQGLFMIAIYNRHWSSAGWGIVKWLYNHAGNLGRKILIWAFTPVIFAAKWLSTRKNPLQMRRGMDFMHNIIDWVGGYPYEYAGLAEMQAILEKEGFQVLQAIPTGVPTGCNQFVCKRTEP